MYRTTQQTYLAERLQSARGLGWPVPLPWQVAPKVAVFSAPAWLMHFLSRHFARFGFHSAR